VGSGAGGENVLAAFPRFVIFCGGVARMFFLGRGEGRGGEPMGVFLIEVMY
jgi:hypothetical protein